MDAAPPPRAATIASAMPLDARQEVQYRRLHSERGVGGVQDEIVTGAEIGRRLGVSRERVRQWASDPKFAFPESLGRVGGAKIWNWLEVQRWADERGRTPVGKGE